LKTLLTALDNVKSDFDGAADVISQMHKHFVTDDELKYVTIYNQKKIII